MLVVVANLVCVGIVALFGAKYIISFEVAWVGAMGVVWSSYKAMMRKVTMIGDSSNGNSSLGASFALGENFGEQQTSSLVLSPKFSPNTKLPPQILEYSNKGDSSDSNATESSLRDFKPLPKSLPQGERFSYSPSLAVDTPPQTPPARGGTLSLSPTLACGESNDSPSLAEGARGWVKPISSLQGKVEATNAKIYDSNKSDSNKSIPVCHTERSEASKVCESNAMQSIMTKKQIVSDSQIVKMDSSPTAQNDNIMGCNDFTQSVESLNDESISNLCESVNLAQKQSKGLRCCFGLFSRETSKIGLGRPSSEVLCENNSNEYPRPNCKQDEFIVNLPKKERFFIGFRLSFGLFRLLSYGFIALSIIALINNGAFYAIPFLLGIALSTLTTTLYAMKKAM